MAIQMKHPFEAVVVRYMHDVLTGEFLNIGVILVCTPMHYAAAEFIPQWSRVSAAFPNAELPNLRRIASVLQEACATLRPDAHGQLRMLVDAEFSDIRSFLASVLQLDDASIDFSPTLRGITANPEKTLIDLANRYSRKYLPEHGERAARQDGDIWQDFARVLVKHGGDLLHRLVPLTLRSSRSHYELQFERAWQNGKWNAAQPLSFDLIEGRAIRDKAANWSGKVLTVQPSQRNAEVCFIVGMPPSDGPRDVQEAAKDAIGILTENLRGEASIFREDQSNTLAEKILADLSHEEQAVVITGQRE